MSEIVFALLKLALGLVFFLFGMEVMSGNLEKMAGGKLELMLKKATSNPAKSLLLGAGITIAIQSSSATTVMLVGLVNSGIMNFTQTLHVIFGANIGTTLTPWILSLSGIEGENLLLSMLKPENFSAVLAFIGIMMNMISKKDSRKSIGTIFVGFAVLMYGMELMKEAVSPLSEQPWFTDLMVKFQNPIFGLVMGTIITAAIQSSAASVGILQALAMKTPITYGMAIPIVMGQNIGTCITAIISCIGANANAKRVAAMHLSINVIGSAILLALYSGLDAILRFAFLDSQVSVVGIALVHTIFNIAITLILAPLSKMIIRIAEVAVKDDKKKVQEFDFNLDERLLQSPAVAVSECMVHSVKMSKISHETLLSAVALYDNFDENIVTEIEDNEDKLDKYEDGLGSYLVQLSSRELSINDSNSISKMLHAIGDFERLGDHAVGLMKNAKEMHTKGVAFSKSAAAELNVLKAAIEDILTLTMQAYETNDVKLALRVEPLEQVIDGLASKIRDNHIARLKEGKCTIEMGFIHSDVINNFKRISDHCSNIAVAIIETKQGNFETHKYLSEYKEGAGHFEEFYEECKQKYILES